jgi:hypothetical protein
MSTGLMPRAFKCVLPDSAALTIVFLGSQLRWRLPDSIVSGSQASVGLRWRVGSEMLKCISISAPKRMLSKGERS